MDCVLMAEQMLAGKQTLGIPVPPPTPPWMVTLSKWVRSQPLLMSSSFLSSTRLLSQTYHSKAMGAPSFPLSMTYHPKPMGIPSPPIRMVQQTYHAKPMGKVGFPIQSSRGLLNPI
jgi:hypothetical protein